MYDEARRLAAVRGGRGSGVTLTCDGGDRYAGRYYNDAWIAGQGLDPVPYRQAVEAFLAGGAYAVPGWSSRWLIPR